MSRTTVLQIIAAVITVAVLAVLHQGLGWVANQLSMQSIGGFLVGLLVMWLVWLYADHEEKSARRRGTGEQQRARHSIDF
ncbi:hypothetical protein FJ955_03090 [Mesorhizobium sp. B2-2-2]|uniref:hypothetical protein n=1 Tax=Mesorhizobium sp. B2-2-2 TaxID=2589964 RepID=UPI0011274998|nr:hypothetical protein [Mesorhizobium sp. B2-2-2]TPM33740.1 hypothetical protein FJ955_03090 [Mesorhizobium sp. B2-2-2]